MRPRRHHGVAAIACWRSASDASFPASSATLAFASASCALASASARAARSRSGRKRLHQLGVAGPFDFQLGGQGVNQGVRGGRSGCIGWLAGRFAGVLQGVGDGRGGEVIEKIGVPVS